MNEYNDNRNYESDESAAQRGAGKATRGDRSAATLLDRLEAELLDAKSVPFSDKCSGKCFRHAFHENADGCISHKIAAIIDGALHKACLLYTSRCV